MNTFKTGDSLQHPQQHDNINTTISYSTTPKITTTKNSNNDIKMTTIMTNINDINTQRR